MVENASVNSCAKDPGRLSELAHAIATRRLSPVDLVHTCLARVEAIEPHVHAWRAIDADRALAVAEQRAREATAGLIRGPLHRIPVAIKDIIDVAGLPTRCNSPVASRGSASDRRCRNRSRAQDAGRHRPRQSTYDRVRLL